MQPDYSEIVQFIKAQNEYKSVLLMECEEIASAVQLQLPNARIYIGKEKNIDGGILLIEGRKVNASDEDIFFEQNSFDYIVVGVLFGKKLVPVKFLRQLLPYLKIEGELLASFYNSHHWSNLEEYNLGQWRCKMKNEQSCAKTSLFSLEEIVELFEQAHCKEIQFSAFCQEAPAALLTDIQQAGFSNEHGELEVLRWGICASKVNKKALLLRKSFDEKTRTTMVFLLRRIENQMDIAQNCAELWQICVESQISVAYLVAMAINTMLYPERVLVLLAIYLYEQGNMLFAIDLLKEAYQYNEESDLMIHTLVSLLRLQERWREMKELLSRYSGEDEELFGLKKQICGDRNERQ